MTTYTAPDLGTLDCYTRRCDVVGMAAIDYRDELAAAVDLMPAGTARFHLEGLLGTIDRALEAKAAFDAARQAADDQYRIERDRSNSLPNLDPSFTPSLAPAHQI